MTGPFGAVDPAVQIMIRRGMADATTPRPALVGQCHGPAVDPSKTYIPLYPYPPGSAGGRLLALTGLSRGDYLKSFWRVNAYNGHTARFSKSLVRRERRDMMERGFADARVPMVIFMGWAVADTFGFCRPLFEISGAHYGPWYPGDLRTRYAVMPHPSGRNRLWNEPGNRDRARELLRVALRDFRA